MYAQSCNLNETRNYTTTNREGKTFSLAYDMLPCIKLIIGNYGPIQPRQVSR